MTTPIKIKILSQARFKSFMHQSHPNQKIGVISIRNIEDSDFSIICSGYNGIVNCIKLYFDDVEKGSTNCMTKEDADKIAKYIKCMRGTVNMIIVHCGAGVSRSAGVGAAIDLYLNGTDKDIFDNPRMCPNMTCYRLTLNALMNNYSNTIDYSESHRIEIDDKEHHNEESTGIIKRVVEIYQTIFDNIGTQDKCFIIESDRDWY